MSSNGRRAENKILFFHSKKNYFSSGEWQKTEKKIHFLIWRRFTVFSRENKQKSCAAVI